MPNNPNPDLMRIFDFTADDLEANRAGKMSERQIKRLSGKRATGQWLTGLGCATALVFVLPIIVSGLSHSMKDSTASLSVILFVVAIPVIYVYLGVMDRNADIRRNHVTMYLGSLLLSEFSGKFRSTYWIFTSSFNMQISNSSYDYLSCLRRNTRFRLYYLQNSAEVISIEVVEDL